MMKPVLNARRMALHILEDFLKGQVGLDVIINRHFFTQALDHRDKRFVFEIVYGVLRNRLMLSFIIDHFLESDKVKKHTELMLILQIAVYQLLYMSKVPDHAAVSEAVDLAKSRMNTMHFAPLTNALLRAVIKEKHHLPSPDTIADLPTRLSTLYSHPVWLTQRYLARFGLARTKELLVFNNQKPDIYLRRKIKGLSRQQFETDVQSITNSATGYLNLYYRLTKAFFPETLHVFKDGLCTVQSPSAGWMVALLDIHQSERLADMCSAPGGKASLMAELAGSRGTVCACDISKNRMRETLDNIKRLNISTIFSVVCDATAAPFSGHFDKVLLDAPCSGTGVMHRHPEARWIKTVDDIIRCSEKQQLLLREATTLVAKNGIIVYATCSLEPEENEDQITRFLKERPDFVLDHPPSFIPDQFVDLNGFVRITPYEHKMDGMFGARLKKVS